MICTMDPEKIAKNNQCMGFSCIYLILQANVLSYNTPNSTLTYYFDICQVTSQSNQYINFFQGSLTKN